MPGEEKQEVATPDLEEVKPDPKTGKLPESIPSTKYIAVKEAWGRAKEKAADLEEKLKNAPNVEEHTKLKSELEKANAKIKELTDAKIASETKTATELRDSLKKQGLTDEQVKDMTVVEMQRMLGILGSKKPSLPDLTGGGGGSGGLKGSPMELARQAYESSNKAKK